MVVGVKRKYISSSSGSDQGAISIEAYLAGKDPFRKAPTGCIPTPWPFLERHCSEEAKAIFQDIEDDCETICKSHGIKTDYITMGSIWRKDMEDETSDILLVDTRDQNSTTWGMAADELKALLDKTALKGNKCKVEVRNYRLMYSDVSSCIGRDAPLLACIREIMPRVEKVVDETLPSIWTSIAYHNRAPDRDRGPGKPSLLVFVRPESASLFEYVEQKLLGAVRSSNFADISLNVEILPGQVVPAGRSHDKYRDYNLTTVMPWNAVSIGVQGSQESGTLGGWVRLTNSSGQVIQCAMTCYHVVRKADDKNHIEDNDESGIGFINPKWCPSTPVVWPSDHDSAEIKKAAEKEVQAGRSVQRVQRAQTTLGILSQLRNTPGGIGKVRFASGHKRTAGNSRIDYAFIESPQTFQQNKPPQDHFSETKKDYTRLIYEPKDDTRITSFGPAMQPGDWVIRDGRSSTTHGEVNTILRRINWEDHTESMEVDVHGMEGDFCQEGDSGSWVVNEEFQLLGMLIGKDRHSKTNNGIVTPIETIIKDFESRAKGFKLSLA